MKILIRTFAVATLPLLVATACSDKEETATSPQRGGPIRAQGYVAHPEQFSDIYSTSGTLLPNEEIEVKPEISGRVTNINFTEGGYVRAGQILVQLYDADIRAQIQKLRSQKELQQKILNRQQELVDIGGISRQEFETTQTQIASIDADIAFQEAQLRKTRIVAPFSGKIGIRNVSEGAIVGSETVIATLQQTNPLKMDFTLPDRYRNIVATGKDVYFSPNQSGDTLKGTIKAISPGADVATRTLSVRAIVPNSNGELVPGTFAHVVIPFDSKEDAILVPSNAVIPTSREKQVAIVEKGKIAMKTVILGTRTSDMVEVISGVQPGDTVITTALMKLKPGADIQIIGLSKGGI